MRDSSGKGVARKLRRDGFIPAVLYGAHTANVLLALEPRALMKAVDTEAGSNTLITLRVEGHTDLSQKVVMLRDLQVDPVRRTPLHADLYEVRMDETITVSIPVRIVGRAAGVEEGGIVDHSLRELEIECLPGSIPDDVEVDVSALAIGDSIHVGDLSLPEGVKVLDDAATTVVAVTTPVAEEAPAVPAEGVAVPVEGAPVEGAAAEAHAKARARRVTRRALPKLLAGLGNPGSPVRADRTTWDSG
jgi:large subunit ribosomal protein L25